MKFKPKEIMVNLPTVLTFQTEDEIVEMASAFNNFVHGKVKMKYEVLGELGGQHVGLFYIQRNTESQQLRDEFMVAINAEEEANHAAKKAEEAKAKVKAKPKSAPKEEDLDDDFDEPLPNFDRGPFTNCWGIGGKRY